MAAIAAAGVGLGIPIVGEFYGSRLVAGGGEEHVGVAAFLVRTAADLAQAEHLEEADRVLERTYADHRVQIFGHWVSSKSACSRIAFGPSSHGVGTPIDFNRGCARAARAFIPSRYVF